MSDEKKVGEVEHYFKNIGVAAVRISGSMKIGDRVHFKGATTDFEIAVESMQISHESVDEVKTGDDVGMSVPERVRKGDGVYRV